MSDNLRIKQPLDAKRINLNEPYEVNYWCQALGVTERQLRDAVKAVGDSSAAVRKYLGK